MKTAPYTTFGKTKEIPLKIVLNHDTIESEDWDEDLWIETPEDWYALVSPQLKNKKVRIIERSVWLRTKEIK